MKMHVRGMGAPKKKTKLAATVGVTLFAARQLKKKTQKATAAGRRNKLAKKKAKETQKKQKGYYKI